MSWDPTWETVFSTRAWGRYPPEELIRFVARRYYDAPDRSRVRVLEVGCGPGPVIWYLAREGFSVAGIDGSPTAIAQARARLAEEGLAADLRVGDIGELGSHFDPETFDAVVDVTSIQQNPYRAIEAIVTAVRSVLRPGGRFFGLMLAEGSWGFGTGPEIEPRTFVDVAEGPLVGRGLSHFFSEAEVRELFGGFEELEVDYSLRTMEHQKRRYKHWLVEARRPG